MLPEFEQDRDYAVIVSSASVDRLLQYPVHVPLVSTGLLHYKKYVSRRSVLSVDIDSSSLPYTYGTRNTYWLRVPPADHGGGSYA